MPTAATSACCTSTVTRITKRGFIAHRATGPGGNEGQQFHSLLGFYDTPVTRSRRRGPRTSQNRFRRGRQVGPHLLRFLPMRTADGTRYLPEPTSPSPSSIDCWLVPWSSRAHRPREFCGLLRHQLSAEHAVLPEYLAACRLHPRADGSQFESKPDSHLRKHIVAIAARYEGRGRASLQLLPRHGGPPWNLPARTHGNDRGPERLNELRIAGEIQGRACCRTDSCGLLKESTLTCTAR